MPQYIKLRRAVGDTLHFTTLLVLLLAAFPTIQNVTSDSWHRRDQEYWRDRVLQLNPSLVLPPATTVLDDAKRNPALLKKYPRD
jgi:hypothetical protein